MNKLNALFTASPDEKLSTRQTLTLIALAGVAAAVIGWTPFLNWLNYPFRLFITIIHELGHGVAGLLTGGGFHSFVISPDGSGLAYTRGGWEFVIIPAGYLGVALFTATLIVLGRSPRWGRVVLGIIGAALIGMSLIFGRPGALSIPAIVGSVLTVITGVIFGALFIKLALQASTPLIVFFLHFMAIKAGFAAFGDIFVLFSLSTRIGPVPRTDALAMAELTHIPAVIWAVIWVIQAFIFIGGAIWAAWLVKK